ncbi:MAG: DUF262 domain-containing protein [Bacteroidetes bacterium]|nr:DUF262 domain-containing protein [Bacteroidota bacterium]MCL2302951.1 DUF262 domain-containing protein [Lentimicrobiaceae bacterium]
MKIELKEITVRELTDNYQDHNENGVVGYGGKLDIRPPFQREFIYKDKQRDAVIDTITKDYPLNVMYWAVNSRHSDESQNPLNNGIAGHARNDDTVYEVIDGQQRTISICQFVEGDFAFKNRYFHNLQNDEKEQLLSYKLMVYLCSGTESEKLEWFKTINIAGEKLTDQELRNAVYAGSWVSDAKRYFSKRGCPASGIGEDYLIGSSIRQDYLETAIDWISKGNIENYMASHQHDPNASALWRYFQDVITWVNTTFTNKRKFMKGVDWGALYNKYKDKIYDTNTIEEETIRLIADDDVTKKSGIYPYILTRDEKYLSIRAFTDSTKQKVFERQNGICTKCEKHFDLSEMEADHITPWHEGGKTIEENCQMLCKDCNRRKSGK